MTWDTWEDFPFQLLPPHIFFLCQLKLWCSTLSSHLSFILHVLNLFTAASRLLTCPGITHEPRTLLRCSDTNEKRLLNAPNTNLGSRATILETLLGRFSWDLREVPFSSAFQCPSRRHETFSVSDLHCHDGIPTQTQRTGYLVHNKASLYSSFWKFWKFLHGKRDL